MTDAETALLLARIQFAFTISFHFIFPAFSIGIASYLAVLEGWIENELFDALDDSRRERLRRATAKRLAELRPSDFVWRRPLVSVAGDRPGD